MTGNVGVPGSHIVCPEDGGWHVIEGRPCQPKIADLQFAIGVGQNILGLQVSMKDFGCASIKSLSLCQTCKSGLLG